MPEKSSGSLSHAAVEHLQQKVTNASAEVLSRQWSAVGGAASSRARANALVDPESLVLMSLTLASSEPRFDDIVSDWTALNADVLSVQRMRNLASHYPPSTQARLPGLARIAFEEAKDHRWKSLVATSSVTIDHRRNKRRAVRVTSNESAALTLRLRLAFGVGIKADLLAFLLCSYETAATVATIAAITDYTPAAVRRAARDLGEAGFVRTVLHAGETTVRYRTISAMWSGLLPRTPKWVDWKARFVFVASLLEWSKNARGRQVTEYVVESALRDLIEEHAVAFETQWPDLAYSPMRSPTQNVESFAEALLLDA